MNITWRQTSPDEIITEGKPKPVLILFGLPFLGIGLWLCWNLVASLWDILSGKVTFLDNWGVVLLPLFAAAFLWPGILMVLTKKRWVISATSGDARSTTSVLFWSWGKRHPLSGFRSVRAYQGKEDTRNITENPSEEDDRRYTVAQPYCVDLVAKDRQGKTQTVGVTTGAAEAIELGKALAALTKLLFVNDTAKDGEDTEEEGARYQGNVNAEE